MTRATVLVPTHDHATTLPLAVRSALQQTESDLEVIILGDGVTEDVRRAARHLVEVDPRVVFLDLEKGPHHGEIHRHTAIEAARGDHILYLCDDDLLMPEHVADLCTLLDEVDLAQCRNGRIDADGTIRLHPGDFAEPAAVARLRTPEARFNFVSLTGTGHTRSWYDRAAAHWQTTPAGIWPDLHQWRRMLDAGPARAATSARMTALQFPSHLDGREHWTPQQRLDELAAWFDRLDDPATRAWLDEAVHEAAWRTLAAMAARLDLMGVRAHTAEAEASLARDKAAVARRKAAVARDKAAVARRNAAAARARATTAQRELAAVLASRSWRFTAGLRALRRRLGRLRH